MNESNTTIDEMLAWLKSQMEFYLPSDRRIIKAIRAILKQQQKLTNHGYGYECPMCGVKTDLKITYARMSDEEIRKAANEQTNAVRTETTADD